jgi:hypothetical protein
VRLAAREDGGWRGGVRPTQAYVRAMHTSLRHYSLSVERNELTGRRTHAHPRLQPERPHVPRRAGRPSFADRIRATLRPGRPAAAGE